MNIEYFYLTLHGANPLLHAILSNPSKSIASWLNANIPVEGSLEHISAFLHPVVPLIFIPSPFVVNSSLSNLLLLPYLVVFKYSPRPKTSASKLPDDVGKEEKERRHRLIYNLQQKITEQINKNYIGKIVEVLVEKESYKKKGYFIGKTHNKKTVLFRKEGNVKIGDIVNVEILNSSIHFLSGRICVK